MASFVHFSAVLCFLNRTYLAGAVAWFPAPALKICNSICLFVCFVLFVCFPAREKIKKKKGKKKKTHKTTRKKKPNTDINFDIIMIKRHVTSGDESRLAKDDALFACNGRKSTELKRDWIETKFAIDRNKSNGLKQSALLENDHFFV